VWVGKGLGVELRRCPALPHKRLGLGGASGCCTLCARPAEPRCVGCAVLRCSLARGGRRSSRSRSRDRRGARHVRPRSRSRDRSRERRGGGGGGGYRCVACVRLLCGGAVRDVRLAASFKGLLPAVAHCHCVRVCLHQTAGAAAGAGHETWAVEAGGAAGRQVVTGE
jgi:hypothetical protein